MQNGKIAVLFAILALTGGGAACAVGDTKIGLGGKDVRKNLTWIEASARTPLKGGDYGRKLQFHSRERFYEIHAPTDFDASAVPLVTVGAVTLR